MFLANIYNFIHRWFVVIGLKGQAKAEASFCWIDSDKVDTATLNVYPGG